MDKYTKIAAIILGLIVLFVICGIGFNYIFRTIAYSFYKNPKPSSESDQTIRKLEIGENKDLIGYARSTDFSKKKKTIIYFGGSEEIAYNAALKYRDIFKDYTFVNVDYPGTQESKGSMNLETMKEAAVRLYDYVVNLDYVDKDKIYVVGYSYGTGMAAYLASQRYCSGLALVAPYREVKDLYNAIIPVFNGPFGWFVTDNINTKEYAKSIEEKTLIITSDGDTTIKKSIPYSLAHSFSSVTVKEFPGLKHEQYWSDKGVVSAVLSFCE